MGVTIRESQFERREGVGGGGITVAVLECCNHVGASAMVYIAI